MAGYIKMNCQEMRKGKTPDEMAEFAASIISGEFSDHLLEAAEKIHRQFPPGAERSKNIFPKLAGSYLDLDNPALFYAKVITRVISAHKEVEENVRSLRRNLFRILGVSEFSEKAAWVEPGMKLILKDVVCQTCGVTQDIDLAVTLTPECECDEIDEKTNLVKIQYRLVELLRVSLKIKICLSLHAYMQDYTVESV